MFFDGAMTVRWVSPAAREVFDLDVDELVGTNGLDLIHADDRDRVLDAFMRGLLEPGDHVRVEFRIRDGLGRLRWVEEIATDLSADPAVGFIIGNLRDITDRVEAHAEQLRAARLDALTGLASRDQLFTMLRTSSSDQPSNALVFFDIVDFCDVNNSLGVAAGDQLLVLLAHRVASVLPAGCTFSRVGNDQFAVLRPSATGLDAALEVVEVIRTALSTPFRLGAVDVFLSVCFGAACQPAESGEDLARQADMALYRAKQEGPDELIVFEPGLERSSHERVSYAAALKLALDGGDVVPHYQPVVELRTGRVVAVEALARWNHPTLGLVPPDTFIPVAEASGLIRNLGAQILRRSCADAAAWVHVGRPLQVAVNVSAIQLTDAGFADLVDSILTATGLAPERLTLEITETSALRDLDAAMTCLRHLDRRGVTLSVDDFGTGYSSLVLLSHLPIGAIKIDRSFVDGLHEHERTAQIVAATVALGTALGFHVVAEGIERRTQVVALAGMGCGFGQGFYWSPAVPAEELHSVIDQIELGHDGVRPPVEAIRPATGGSPLVAKLREIEPLPDPG
ncbi:hypothetical protein BH10ACT1_BH10ACT1_04460 [soil metagenome]